MPFNPKAVNRVRAVLAALGATAAAVLAVSVLVPSVAEARMPRSGAGPVQIVAPKFDSLQRGRRIRLAARVRRRAKAVRARIDGRRLRLRRSGTRRSARLSRRRLGRGVHIFAVSARDRDGRIQRDEVRFIVAGRRARLARVVVRRSGGKSGPLAMVMRTRRSRWTVVRAYLNGRRVHTQLEKFDRYRRRGSFSPSEGLRFGVNRLRIAVYERDGRYQRITRRIRVRRSRPLASAGRDRAVRPHRRIVLSGRRSRATHRGRRLAYRWSLIRKPRGARVRLARADSARPRLRVSRRGSYRFRLRVVERRGRRTVATGHDVVTLSAEDAIPPIGAPIKVSTSGIDLLDQSFPFFSTSIMFVQIDRAGSQGGTLEVMGSHEFEYSEAGELVKVLTALDSGSIVVLAGGSQKIGDDTLKQVNDALARIGAAPIAKNKDGIAPAFAAIGIPGTEAGQAYQSTAPAQDIGTFPAMSGYLTRGTQGKDALSSAYTFAPSEYVPFTTDSSGLTLGCTQTTQVCDKVAPTTGQGFTAAVYDAYSLDQVTTMKTDASQAGLNSLGLFLAGYSSDPSKIVFLLTSGSPFPNYSEEWTAVAQQVHSLHGNIHVFNTFNPPNAPSSNPEDYALAGGAGIEAQDFAGPKPQAGGPINLSGVLQRNGAWRFEPIAADPLGNIAYDLLEIAYQPPSKPTIGFPYSASDQTLSSAEQSHYAAAEAYVAQHLDAFPSTTDVRSQYWQTNDTWADWKTDLDDMRYKSGNGFSSTEFANLKRQLETEFTSLDQIRDKLGNLNDAEQAAYVKSTQDNKSIVDRIQAAVNPPTGNSTLIKILNTFEYIADIASEAAGFLGGPRPPAGSPGAEPNGVGDGNDSKTGDGIGIAGAVLGLAAVWTQDGDGNKILNEVQAKATEVNQELANGVVEAYVGFERLREILVSDWGKLQATANLLSTKLPWDGDQSGATIAALNIAARRLAYESLMPVAFRAYCPIAGENPEPSDPSGFYETTGWTGSAGHLQPVQRIFWSKSAAKGIFSNVYATPELTTLDDIGAGWPKSDFWVRAELPGAEDCNTPP